MRLRSLADLEVKNKTVLLRVDFNVPLAGGEVADDQRIRAAIPTIKALQQAGARVVCCSHLGRPKGRVVPELSMVAVGQALATLLNARVRVTEHPNGPAEDLESMGSTGVALLENLRFDAREEANDPALAQELASLADVFVNDAFGAVHRAHASVTGVSALLPSAAGLLLHREIEVLSRVLESPTRPFVVVLGGSKVSDKLGVVGNLLDKADSILIGGAMANTFLAASGISTGGSKIEADRVAEVAETIRQAKAAGVNLLLPIDVKVAEAFDEKSPSNTVDASDIGDSAMALDIGPETAKLFAKAVSEAATVLWNGPMGVFEWESFSEGTKTVAEAVGASSAFTVVGGGDSAAALAKFGLTQKIDHLSTGGGASLEFLEGKPLPGLAPLQSAD
ncbi:MAG: phosphoglycerate kinase [Actinomycetota bacterium]